MCGRVNRHAGIGPVSAFSLKSQYSNIERVHIEAGSDPPVFVQCRSVCVRGVCACVCACVCV